MLNKIPKQLLLLLTLPLLLGFSSLAAQDITVSGEVIAADDGLPLPGVNILVVGTDDVGTVTNIDGEYQLTVPEGYNELRFSFIGYRPVVIPIDGREVINVTMEMATVAAGELVVIGYGQARSMDLTAPISTITAETISRNVTTNAISALQGAVPGTGYQSRCSGLKPANTCSRNRFHAGRRPSLCG